MYERVFIQRAGAVRKLDNLTIEERLERAESMLELLHDEIFFAEWDDEYITLRARVHSLEAQMCKLRRQVEKNNGGKKNG